MAPSRQSSWHRLTRGGGRTADGRSADGEHPTEAEEHPRSLLLKATDQVTMLVRTEPGSFLRRGSSRGGANMSTKEHGTRSLRAPMAWKFFLLVALIVPSTLAVSWVGGRGMQQMKVRLDVLYEDNLTSIQAVSRLSLALEEAKEMSLRLIGDVDPVSIDRVRTELREEVFPAVEQQIGSLRSISESSEERALVDHLHASWEEFRAFTDSPEFLAASDGRAADDRFIESKTETLS